MPVIFFVHEHDLRTTAPTIYQLASSQGGKRLVSPQVWKRLVERRQVHQKGAPSERAQSAFQQASEPSRVGRGDVSKRGNGKEQ